MTPEELAAAGDINTYTDRVNPLTEYLHEQVLKLHTPVEEPDDD